MNNIKKLRVLNEYTQLELHMKTGIAQSVLSKYERGERLPTVDNLMILADFYGTSMDYLMGRTNEPGPYPRAQRPGK